MNSLDISQSKSRSEGSGSALVAVIATICLTLLPIAGTAASSPRQIGFDSAVQAVQALVEAARADRPQQLLKIFGRAGRRLVFSGDPVADRLGRAKFVAAYDEAHRIEPQGDSRALLIVGEKEWPFPIPMVRHGRLWRFDAHAGVEAVIDRRIGRNELDAIEVCRAYVDAQRDFAALVRRSDGQVEYAQHFMSSPDKRDGLYWPIAAGEPESPMGPLVARARAAGYLAGKAVQHGAAPYHGYFYRILKRQGAHAPDGARDYLVDGRMSGGFALVAFPAHPGDSGIMTFIVNQDGIVYQKNLGRHTENIARRMREFDPGPSWSKVPPATEPSAAP